MTSDACGDTDTEVVKLMDELHRAAEYGEGAITFRGEAAALVGRNLAAWRK
jgi:uncharacterized membrane protein